MAMMQTKGLYRSLLATEEQPNDPAPLASGASNAEKKNHKVLKDAYENEVADIKEKRNNVWCHLALTLDATTLMLMRHDCVGDDGIGEGAKAWKLLQERFQSVETPTVVTLVAKLAQLQLEDAEDLDSFFIRGQGLLTRLQEAREAVSETLFNAWVLNVLPMRYESFVIQESFNPATNFTELRKRPQNFHESKVQRHKGQSGSVALAVKRDFKKGPKKENCFVWDPWTLCQGLQEEGDSTMNQAWSERSPRQGIQERKRWRQTGVSGNGSNIGFTRRGTLGSSYPVERQQAC